MKITILRPNFALSALLIHQVYMKKNKLDVSFHFDFDLLGIISTVKEYKLAWHINRVMGIHLIKSDDLEIEFLNQQTLIISNFVYETEISQIRLLKNKSVRSGDQTNYLIPELHKFDFLLTIFGFDDTFPRKSLITTLKGIQQVQFIQQLPIDQLKSRENLIF